MLSLLYCCFSREEVRAGGGKGRSPEDGAERAAGGVSAELHTRRGGGDAGGTREAPSGL